MSLQDEIRQMIIAARLYYENNRTQAEVAADLGVSRPTVSRLLQRALDEGIVQIKISDPYANHRELAQALCQITGLEKAIVVPGESPNSDVVRRRISLAAANHLSETLVKGDILGIGWGRTLYEVSLAVDPRPLPGLLAIPLLGGLGQVAPSFQVHDVTRRIAENYGGGWQQFYVPAIVRDQVTRDSLLNSQDVQAVVSNWKRMTVALIGIGNVAFDREMEMLFVDYLEHNDRSYLAESGAVGDIVMRFFDIEGKEIPYVDREVNGVELDLLHRTPNVIAVAGGKEKARAILGAVRGGYIRTLVTDEQAARAVLALCGE